MPNLGNLEDFESFLLRIMNLLSLSMIYNSVHELHSAQKISLAFLFMESKSSLKFSRDWP